MKPEISQLPAAQFSSRLCFWITKMKTFSRPLILLAAIFQDGGQADKLRRKMFKQSLRIVMLSIQKLKRIANRTIFHRDMVDERSRNRKIVSVMTTIFQDGGQTNKFRRKMFIQSSRTSCWLFRNSN